MSHFTPAPSCCAPLAVPGVGLSLTLLGAGCQCLIPSLAGIFVQEGSLCWGQTSAWCFSPSQSLILDGKAWWYLRLGGEAEQVWRERSVSQNSGEFGPIPPFPPPGVNSGSCTSQQVCVTTHNQPVLYVQRHPSCFPAGAFL